MVHLVEAVLRTENRGTDQLVGGWTNLSEKNLQRSNWMMKWWNPKYRGELFKNKSLETHQLATLNGIHFEGVFKLDANFWGSKI